MDGLGGTAKNKVFRHVKSNKVKIDSAKDFAEYADKIVNGIKSLYMFEDEILSEQSDIEEAPPSIKGTLQVHKVVRKINQDNICNLEFFYLASETDPFHIQWYRKDGDPEVCGHAVARSKNDSICVHCEGQYKKGEDWLKCTLCAQWFHEGCFHVFSCVFPRVSRIG